MSEVRESCLPFPVKKQEMALVDSKKETECCVLRPVVTGQHSIYFLVVCKFVNYLEQSCPLHPGLQWHRFGLMHRPPLRQGEEHTARGNTKMALECCWKVIGC